MIPADLDSAFVKQSAAQAEDRRRRELETLRAVAAIVYSAGGEVTVSSFAQVRAQDMILEWKDHPDGRGRTFRAYLKR
jgi:predicted metal-dependent RNase